MTDVSALGLGAIGSALARVLLEKGHAVSVWNRTAAKAVPPAARGARVAESAAATLEAGLAERAHLRIAPGLCSTSAPADSAHAAGVATRACRSVV
ncbi:MAG: NAD(P)-binding domain-containing protein [Myxococcota bacterium]|nr:NAD(P)-binding domain-containing protein [Myxococcota bacterium]